MNGGNFVSFKDGKAKREKEWSKEGKSKKCKCVTHKHPNPCCGSNPQVCKRNWGVELLLRKTTMMITWGPSWPSPLFYMYSIIHPSEVKHAIWFSLGHKNIPHHFFSYASGIASFNPTVWFSLKYLNDYWMNCYDIWSNIDCPQRLDSLGTRTLNTWHFIHCHHQAKF